MYDCFKTLFSQIKNQLKNLTLIVSIVLFLYISNDINIFTMSLIKTIGYFSIIICSIVSLSIFSYKKSHDKSLLFAAMISNGIIYMIAYSTIRSIIGMNQIEEYLINKFTLTYNQLNWFKTIFSLGYGLFQFLSGYLIGKFGNRVIGLFGLGSAICILSINVLSIDSLPLLLMIRFLNGIFVSCGILCIGYQLRMLKMDKHNYAIVFNTANVLASTMNTVSMNQLSKFVAPYMAMNILFMMFLVPSLIFLIVDLLSRHTYNKEIEETPEIIEDPITYKDAVKNAFLNKKYNLMFVQSILMIVAGWTLRDNFLMNIAKNKDIVNSSTIQNTLKYLLEAGYIFGFLLILFCLKTFGYVKLMRIFVICNLISCVILLLNNYYNVNIYLLYCAIFSIGFSVKAHLLPQILAGSSEKSNTMATSLIGLFNAGVMLIGLPFCQKIMPQFSLFTASIIFIICGFICYIISLYHHYYANDLSIS